MSQGLQTGILFMITMLVMITGYALADSNTTNISAFTFSSPDPVVTQVSSASHDYVLQKVTVSGDYSYVRPGRSISPRIVVHNQGSDDIAEGNVPVEAWLGDILLIPVSGDFPPLEGGKSAMYTLRYMIPPDIPVLSYHLTLQIDPWNERGEKGTGTNEGTTQALIVIEDRHKEWDDF